jgi:two-component system, response regulator PdtaR
MSSRILIAEDETIIRLDLRQMLEANGFEVVGEARDGVEAIVAAREFEPDVVLLDIRMPGVDGVECARRIYAERPVPIVMVTAHGDRGLVERALAAGAFGYLTKPFREADLIPAIRSAVIRHADLLDARRALGQQPSEGAVEISITSSAGTVWPLRVERRPDGKVEVSVVDEP